jgi:hypothetical protein
MPKYVKKPVAIEAFHVGVDTDTPIWINDALKEGILERHQDQELQDYYIINPHDGNLNGGRADVGCYILQGIKGEIYTCEADIFEASYQEHIDITPSYLHLNQKPVELDDVTEFVDNNDLHHIDIKLQSAPILEVGVNGLQIDDVIVLIHNIIKSFNNRFPCRENSMILTKLQEAKAWSDIRTENRQKRGVEGKSEA